MPDTADSALAMQIACSREAPMSEKGRQPHFADWLGTGAVGQNQKSVTSDSLPESGHSHHLVGSQASE